MSECVVRMEFPLNCLECPMYDWNRQKLCCNAHHDLRPIPNGGVPKPDWCPIVCQLPEGHGRLVDADANFLGVIHLDGGGFANYNTTIAERLGKEDMWAVKTIVPAEAERSEK